MSDFEIISEISDVELIARGPGIRDIARLNREYGMGNWRKVKGTALLRLNSGRLRRAELYWYEAHGIRQERNEAQVLPGMAMSKQTGEVPEYVVCIDNSDYPASLELHKIYRDLSDEDASADGDLRIIDESGEDYLYSADRFVPIAVPIAVRKSLELNAIQLT
jgi:hypothetical protein